ncbi:hypothetical protein QEO94_11225 [Kingella negevensis]|uniref:hypothetical protein n=1 Tax=Kingella negevensis TaxID=1522312 RepID=UPI0025431E58|nr:hypothetical protein [Kingella negevensis]WII93171.1 hypothetical protein QEO94_11225 [Kingella negevensis]
MTIQTKILLALIANLAYAAALVGAGYAYRDTQAQTQIAELQMQHKATQLKATQQYAEQLSGSLKKYEQWAQTAQTLNQQHADRVQTINNTAAQLKKEIPHVIQQDHLPHADCFGTHSLQQYQKSFGY